MWNSRLPQAPDKQAVILVGLDAKHVHFRPAGFVAQVQHRYPLTKKKPLAFTSSFIARSAPASLNFVIGSPYPGTKLTGRFSSIRRAGRTDSQTVLGKGSRPRALASP